MSNMQKKVKDDDEGILGDGLAELARKQLRDRQSQLDAILGESTSTKPAKPKKTIPDKEQKRERQRHEFM